LEIFLVLGFSNPFPGSAWTRVGFFADNWSKRGHSIGVLGTFGYTTLQKRGTVKFGRVYTFNIVPHLDLTYPLLFIMNSTVSFIISTFFFLTKKPNITLVSVPPGDVGLGALAACQLLRVKYLIDYRDQWEDYMISHAKHKMESLFCSIVRRFATVLYTKSQLLVSVTPNLVEGLKHRGVTNIAFMPNGVDVKTFKPLSNKKENQDFRILYIGSVGGYYRLDVAVKSVKKLVDKGFGNVKLVIAGCGEVQATLDLALELGIPNNVEYKGVLSDNARLAQLIAGADVGLIPYDDDPLWKNCLPAKFFEYCGCGVPVIATVYEDSILANLIEENDIGLTVSPMDEDKLAEAIATIYKNASFKEAAGKRARSLIEEKFDRNKIAEEFLNLIETVVRH